MNSPSRSVVLAIALVLGLLVSAGLAQADDAAWKAAHDTDPHLPLTSQQLEMTAAKRTAEGQSISGSGPIKARGAQLSDKATALPGSHSSVPCAPT